MAAQDFAAPSLDRAVFDPDHQMPLPFPAAEAYGRQAMAWAREPAPSDMVVARDLAYGPHRLHRYDLFAPAQARHAPVLVFWHGGGWTNGYRDYVRFMAPHVVRLGLVLVAPSYRLAPEHRLPAAFDDGLLALQHISANVQRWGGAPQRLLLAGHSAGGHLAALIALREADRVRAGLAADAVRACLPISAIMDLHHPAPAPGSLEERVYTMVLSEPSDDAAMSPLCWTAGNRVPFVLSCGERDSERVLRSNRRMAALLGLQQARVALRVMPGEDHFQTHLALRDPQHPWYRRLAQLAQKEVL